mmetsp:Transcript_2843/g.3898  ORF Transcript_2843/g.3898 Transcript_2843/m.3898 type:complete len:132 (+) Transcript_2843:211-606(+)|eukprot:CAMPEP_0185724328 /NCGR_PEP_ID=MMETSP1171-20130828/838_1 /TAXON_ID=374046 /ORGANISM="Helicotheca tamensis, Strain CCMP826" /LENGTH=131 /DNA_ID=CAMNT_0028392151 /DNA_START=179 /DNA_END=574 /DNA_ORIENTATION=+
MIQNHHSDITQCFFSEQKRKDKACKTQGSRVQCNERNESLLAQQRVQECQNGGSLSDVVLPSRIEETEVISVKANIFQKHCSDFLELSRPKKNGKTRVSTEFHFSKLGHCFERMLDYMDFDIDDLSDDDEE